MAESLFDNRYRYDYIYPRGRSGETLRAVDTQANNRPVVIKRPAPNDAPPIRAGQEVSIINERRALQRLTGHPVLTELLNEGQFFVGGTAHRYIVMERAEGLIIGDVVLELDSKGERLPELEMLVITDKLLDLLRAAHARDIVYNDVDAKHLFWQRENYNLKVIDWGNAIFLEGDDVTPQGISRQTDVYQVGELLYFICTGGHRADVPRDAGISFQVNFGDDAARVHPHLQRIISRALHPNISQRYDSLSELRRDLNVYRQPLERDRNSVVGTVADRLRRDNLSKAELRQLRNSIVPALEKDPGFPAGRDALNTIEDRLRDISVEADLDAVRIYIESHNWNRAADLLGDLRNKTGTQTEGLVGLLLDVCVIMTDAEITTPPVAIDEALGMLFDGKTAAAAEHLLAVPPADSDGELRWQIAERISSQIPDVLLLRPNLYRLQISLQQIEQDGYDPAEPRALLNEIEKTLEDIAGNDVDLPALRDGYRAVVDQLTTLNPLLQTFAMQHQLPNRRVPISSLDRALNAAMALADSMHVIGRQATSRPREALNALSVSRNIDPTNPVWNDLKELLNRLYSILQACQTYVPAADGSDLEGWFGKTRQQLAPFSARFFDEMLDRIVDGLTRAEQSWIRYQQVVLQGNRDTATEALQSTADTINTLAPALSAWLKQLRSVVAGANYIERHALPGGLGRALADGWEAFDKGRLSDAERLGQQALEAARNEPEQLAASRLRDLNKATRDWVEREGVSSADRTARLLNTLENLFTEEESALLSNFEQQMPGIETYLKAMSRGIVATFTTQSTAALRTLYVYYVMQGTLDLHEEREQDSSFWIEAAQKTMPNLDNHHIVLRTLTDYIKRQADLEVAAGIVAQIKDRSALTNLDQIRRDLEGNAQARLLAPGIQSLSNIDVAVRQWADGDFRAAGLQLDQAVSKIGDLEKATQLDCSAYRAWLMSMMEVAAELAVQFREVRSTVDRKPDEPDGTIRTIFRKLVDDTDKTLGEGHSAKLRQWRDTYEAFVDVLASDERRTKRLDDLSSQFRAMFIDQHPTYPLFRHWYNLLDAQAEFAAPPTEDPLPRLVEESEESSEEAYGGARYADGARTESGGLLGNRMVLIGGIATIAIIGVIAFLALSNNSAPPEIVLTITATPEETEDISAAAALATEEPTEATEEIVPSDTASPTATATPMETEFVTQAAFPTNTPFLTPTVNEREVTIAPTETVAESATPTATLTATHTPTVTTTPTQTFTPTITNTPSPLPPTALPEGGVRGTQSMIALFSRLDTLPFNPQAFSIANNEIRLGTGAQNNGNAIRIVPPQALLETQFGNDSAARLRSMEIDIQVASYVPQAFNEDNPLLFGIAFDSVEDGNNIGLQVEVVGENAINLILVQNNETSFIRQRAIPTINNPMTLRLERVLGGNIAVSFNGELLDDPYIFMPVDTPLLPVIFVSEGGVVMSINRWQIGLN